MLYCDTVLVLLLCLQVERKLEEAEQQLKEQSSSTQAANEEQQQQLTPRPADWGQAQQLADACKVGGWGDLLSSLLLSSLPKGADMCP